MSVFSSRFSIFSDRNFALFTLGNMISWLGAWSQRVGIGWLSWDLSHSTAWVGLVSLAQYLPLIFFSPLFGSLLDRCDKRRYAIITNGVSTALAVILYVVTALDVLTIETLCMLSALLGVASSAYQPVRLTLANDLAPPGRLAEAIATNSMVYNLTRTIGPALAGVAIATLGVAATFAINAISYAAIIFALMVVDMRAAPRRPSEGFVKDFVAGVRYVTTHNYIGNLMLLSMVVSTLGRGVVELMPAFAGGLYQSGSSGLAVFTTAGGIGAVLGAVLLSKAGAGGWVSKLSRRTSLFVGVNVVILGLVPAYWLAVLVVGSLGLLVVISSVGLQVLLQTAIKDSFRGRVLGLWGMCNVAGPGVGGAVIGYMAHPLGLRGATIVSGVTCTVLAAWIMHRSRGWSERESLSTRD